jgi:integrase
MGSIREFIKKDGSKSYHAEIRLRGHPVERDNFRTRSAAKKWIQDTESAIRDGRHSKVSEAKRHTVGELIDRFITQWLPKNPKSQTKQTALLLWWKQRLGHLMLVDLTSGVIAEARDALLLETTKRKKLRSPSTVNRYLASLSRALSVAVQEWGWIDDSPMRKVSKPSEAPGRERFLSIEEKDCLLLACKQSSNSNLYPLVSLSILTAMRYSELVNLKWSDVDFNMHTITLRETKNGDRRVIPLTGFVETVLKQCSSYVEDAVGLIFKSQRENRSGLVSIRSAFQRAMRIAGIKEFRWHDLRHTAASYLAMNGATQGELMAILGHRSPHMTRRYAHFSRKHLTALMERAGNNFFGGINE